MTHQTQTTVEREGYCATCSCGYVRWAHSKAQAAEFARLHRPKDKES